MFRCRFIFVAVLLMSASALALPVVMTANDGANTSSYNCGKGGTWNPAGAPVAGNTYYTLGYLMRSPVDATGAYLTGDQTFAGSSLTVGGGTGGGAFVTGTGGMNNNSLICKASGLDLIVSNLILDASYIRDGLGSANSWSIAGNILVSGNGGGFANQCTFNVNSVISGSGKLYIADNGSGEAGRVTIINSGLNTYNGSIQLNGQSAARSRLTFADNSLMNFTIGANGVNNSISGTGTATFNGDFWFNLAGASKNLGDSWTLASAASQTFSDTFTVLGFDDIGGNDWLKWITPNTLAYMFNESTGILNVVVPEPATMALLGLGGLSLLRIRKRR